MQLPNDPKQWSREQVEWFAEQAAAAELQATLAQLAQSCEPDGLEVLRRFLSARGGSTYEKRLPSVLAGRALLSCGPPGVQVLAQALVAGSSRYQAAHLEALLRATRGDYSADALLREFGPELPAIDPPEDTATAATRALSDFMAEALVNPERLVVLGTLLHQVALEAPSDPSSSYVAAGVLSMLSDASIRLSPSLLDEFETLIAADLREEEYQQFLTEHPALLDPLAAEVLPRQRLGTEYATDYAVRRHDDRWLLVEIERPQDRIFTIGNDFQARFTHGYGQVLDFQQWVDEHRPYAEAAMPSIVVPRGLLVIGRRSELTQRQTKKLAQLVSNSARIDVVTFDDLLQQARTVYTNLHHRRGSSA